MLTDEVSSNATWEADQCPPLAEADDGDSCCMWPKTVVTRGDSTITKGPEMFTLWESLQVVANDDDGT